MVCSASITSWHGNTTVALGDQRSLRKTDTYPSTNDLLLQLLLAADVALVGVFTYIGIKLLTSWGQFFNRSRCLFRLKVNDLKTCGNVFPVQGICGVYEGICGVYESICGVYEGICGVYEGICGVYEGICGVYEDLDLVALIIVLTSSFTRCQMVCPSGYTVSSWHGNGCVDTDECHEGGLGQCSQMCTNTQGSFRCSCYHGYSIDNDGWTCHADGPPFYLIFSQGTEIFKLQPEGIDHRSLLQELGNAVAIDYHYQYNSIFWVDTTENILYKASLEGTHRQAMLKLGDTTVVGLAVDWIHDYLYWTDAENNNVEMSALDGSHRQTVVHLSALTPRSIAVNPIDGWLYWTSWGASSRIIRSRLDGSDITPLVFSSIIQPNGLTLDFVDERLYWVDNGTRTLESCHWNGTDRRLILHTAEHQPFAVTTFLSHIYWTDWNSNSLTRATKYNGEDIVGISTNHLISPPIDVKIVHPYRQPWSTPIDGDCNSTECSEPKPLPDRPFVVFSNKNDLRRMNFDGTDYRHILQNGMKNVLTLDYDPIGKMLYFADADFNKIERVSVDGSLRDLVIAHDLSVVEGLAVDWIHRKIYWTELGNSRISRSDLDGTNREVIISHNISKPRGIAVFPQLELFYWTDWGDQAKIEVSSLDGTQRSIIATSNVTWPNGITIDYHGNKVIWCDAKHNTIEEANLDGSERRIVTDFEITHPFAITQFNQHIWYTDWARPENVIFRVDQSTGLSRVRLQGSMSQPSGLQIIHPTVKKPTNIADINLCSILNGRCDHLCYHDSINKAICACRQGYRLQEDMRSCQIDECLAGIAECDVNAICIDTPTSYQCHCKSEYIGDGFSCSRVVEEALPTATGALSDDHHTACGADHDAYCYNGGTCSYSEVTNQYKCQCMSGFLGIRCQLDTQMFDSVKGREKFHKTLYISLGVALPVVIASIVITIVCCVKSRHKKHNPKRCNSCSGRITAPNSNGYYENRGPTERIPSTSSYKDVARSYYSRTPRQISERSRNTAGSRHHGMAINSISGSAAARLKNQRIVVPKPSKLSMPSLTKSSSKENGIDMNRDSYIGVNKRADTSNAIAISPISNATEADDYMDMSQGRKSSVYVNIELSSPAKKASQLRDPMALFNEKESQEFL
ncbi:low-density lipoprotein receptor-related protein 4-like [Saccoglossus kowalevskii]|uniref:Low-density lipoprotein receptor-related protein 4-like n=1 Tax=Saccoglossus kowalevskii TaxID=10224 RepID=A0ABM0LUV3_SACKO|nr:PREDICTED: low-density lipoprotein receptor-related protein 4-like [Saccoglossus kowalevskii]